MPKFLFSLLIIALGVTLVPAPSVLNEDEVNDKQNLEVDMTVEVQALEVQLHLGLEVEAMDLEMQMRLEMQEKNE
uniref:Uncharacterized protein n=1 Tax=Ditylenchus dipsaci TaxID=166011 RepID=A0A915DR21_9BILA